MVCYCRAAQLWQKIKNARRNYFAPYWDHGYCDFAPYWTSRPVSLSQAKLNLPQPVGEII